MPKVEKQAPFSDDWRLLCRIGEEMNIMVRHGDEGINYAPLYVHSFPLVQPHFMVDAEQYNITYYSLSEIDNTADKLRWCRYRKGLLQREVADCAGIDRTSYISYEKDKRDVYPLDQMQKIATLFEVDITELLDEYNTFLYKGQAQQIRALRNAQGLTQRQYAQQLGIPYGTLMKWEHNRVQMLKCTWEKFFKNKLAITKP